MAERLSAGVVVIRYDCGLPRFLMLRAFRHWDFPKGRLEANETPLAAAVREVEEETTIADLSFRWGELYQDTGPYNRGKVARYYLAETQQTDVSLPVNPEIGRPEHHEYRWVTFSAALELASPRLRPIILWAADVLNLRAGEED
jgi:8-oxo-dGTP pyrophosphatase MutT (NUDIX family)